MTWTRLVEWFMERHRGRNTVIGRAVFRADVRWLKRNVAAVVAARDGHPR